MARSIIAALLFLFPFSAHAQTLPEAPKPKLQLAEHAALTAAAETFAMLDSHSTREVLSRGGVENDPLFRPFAHSGTLYAAQTAETAGFAWLGWKMHHSGNPYMRRFWWVPQVAQIGLNMGGWRHNVGQLNIPEGRTIPSSSPCPPNYACKSVH